jgi:hypothetical protein
MQHLCTLLAVMLVATPALQGGQDRLAGNYKVVFYDRGELLTFWLLKLEVKDGKVTGKLDTVPQSVPDTKLDELTVKDDTLTAKLNIQGTIVTLNCKVPKGEIKSLKGSLGVQTLSFPMQLQATKEDDVKKFKASVRTDPAIGNYKELKAQLGKQMDELTVFDTAEALVDIAEDEKVSAADLKADLAPVLKAAGDYGDAWMQEITFKFAGRLSQRETYAALGEDMARLALKSAAANTDLELRALGIMATALRKQKKAADLAKVVDQINGLEVKGHEENEKAGLGFAPAKFAGRKGNRVVLVELFTGAQCPPCVAADLAFEGLAKTYNHSEVVLLQYHLHIPGPDPMTSQDTISRQKYYGKDVRGTPTIFFNGASKAGGGGGKLQAEGKYKQYCGVIDPLLDESTKVTLTLDTKRAGDVVTINATAGGYTPGDKLRLRFVLVESWVRFKGGNGLSYHAHVVRALPGGPAGFALAKADAKETAKIDLGELRETNTKYLDTVPGIDPARPFSFRNLHVVAFIQDDNTQEVLHAVEVPVK